METYTIDTGYDVLITSNAEGYEFFNRRTGLAKFEGRDDLLAVRDNCRKKDGDDAARAAAGLFAKWIEDQTGFLRFAEKLALTSWIENTINDLVDERKAAEGWD